MNRYRISLSTHAVGCGSVSLRSFLFSDVPAVPKYSYLPCTVGLDAFPRIEFSVLSAGCRRFPSDSSPHPANDKEPSLTKEGQ